MGIDIRDGLQMECITCALCIDACDGVMDKLGRDKGLIGYSTLHDYTFNMALATAGNSVPINPSLVRGSNGGFNDKVRHFNWRIIFRPRIILYSALWTLVGIGLLVGLATRDRLQLDVLHDRNPQFVLESDGSIRNGYTIKVLNMQPEPRSLVLSISDLPGANMTIAGEPQSKGRSFEIQADADSVYKLKLYVTVPKDQLPAAMRDFTFHIAYPPTGESYEYKSTFIAPEKRP
jgi:polyferredoxin